MALPQRPYGQTYKMNVGASGQPPIASKQQAYEPYNPFDSSKFVPADEVDAQGKTLGQLSARDVDPQTGNIRQYIDPNDPFLGRTPIDYSKNYYGYSADQSRPIERIGNVSALDPNAFTIYGFGQQQGIYDKLQQNALGQQFGANVQAGIQQGNAQQSRALALDALTATGPSVAETQLFQGQEAAARNAIAMARSGRGFGSGGQMRQAQFAGQEALGAANQQAAMLRAQEEAQRRQQLLALGGMDLSALGQAYGQQQATGQQALQSLIGQAALSSQQQAALADQAKTNMGIGLDVAKTNANFANYEQPAPVDNTWQDVGAATGAIGGGAAGLAALIALSDRSSKTDIKPTTLADKFEGVGSHSYLYKEPTLPGAKAGPQNGPMADELRALGVTMASADGYERVDAGRLALANASATGELVRDNKDLKRRLRALEAA